MVASAAAIGCIVGSHGAARGDDKKPDPPPAAKPGDAKAKEPPPPPDDPKLDDAGKKALAERTKASLSYILKEKNRETVRRQIAAMGKSADIADRDALFEFSRGNPNHDFVDEAFKALVLYKAKPTFDFLMGKDALTGTDFLIQIAAAFSLGEMKHGYAVPALITVLEGKMTKIEVQGACLIALGKCGKVDERAMDAVMRNTAHKQDTVRANAIEAMGHLKTDDAYGRLLDRLASEKNTRCRGAAATGLGILGRKDAADALRAAAKNDAAQTVREEAIKALGALGLKL